MKTHRALLALVGAFGLTITAALPALAHPLGNFTINRFSQVQVNGDRIDILYVLDYAEIPTFQEKQRIADNPGYIDQQVRLLSAGLILEAGGHRLPVTVADHAVAFLPGQGGLQTMRLQIDLRTSTLGAGRQSATYQDSNYSGRLGWKEIIVQTAAGARLLASSTPDRSVSNALRRYPQDMLTSPLNVINARFVFMPGPSSDPRGETRSPVSAEARGGGLITDRFAALIAPPHPSLSLLLLSLLTAIALGAMHALSPGHGKAVMAAYLVGARGTPRHAIGLALTITATHTAGVFLLGFVTLYAASLMTPERLYPWMTMLSGLLILAIGTVLVLARARAAFHRRVHDHCHDDHHHPERPMRRRNLLALGISSGIIPCPSALVVLLAAISLHRLPLGVLLIVAFSTGLATTLTGIGLALAGGLPLLLRVRGAAGHRIFGRAVQLVPIASALIVIIAGLGLTVQAIPGVK